MIDSLPFAPRRVVLDPDHWILASIREGGNGEPGDAPAVYPNPAREGATFLVRARDGQSTRISLYDIAGRKVRALGSVRGNGFHVVPWDGAGDSGNQVASGVYIVKVESPGGSSTARIVVLH